MENQWTARPLKVVQGVVILSLVIVVLAFIYGKFIHHPLRVWVADGEWCVRFSPDGSGKVLYGSECDR
ncbi:hypothetical protein NIES2135_38950 [Leptolyngbya boryana NIES-2135]|jgi:hypothetical protein|uniref:Uncharacterized protein n=1 Tax=Leptolyngbya boryana NIES-2135 TaxID=1973484 RepID=A0A1Z4JJV8_LEPBY|nr:MULTISPECIES: hypothetical protein [Leptolyngbya]BAY57032.1 hypothetical protein NIES2135_38950 [Leptolyngbya boryana NIES-2135]MBD2367211.1 hypothetical protein [Leptolyngbya sp. FACHB-161]MBD2373435.1 hypothetical protein [Leptolyngbya sp. FACHB-238]MBD2397844.1 hypothetical protein [Leptolyngbya sp. FACHB-239]MBD2404345.1 hypothetical protein [Leptolyngbya sp. FACHB-402]